MAMSMMPPPMSQPKPAVKPKTNLMMMEKTLARKPQKSRTSQSPGRQFFTQVTGQK